MTVGMTQPVNRTSDMPDSKPQQREFERKLQDRQFFSAFASVVKDLVQLRIITVIEDEIDFANSASSSLNENEGRSGQRIATLIDLLDGDIKNVVGSRFIENPGYTDLRTFHATEVEKGQRIIAQNLDTLQKSIKALIEIAEAENKLRREDSSSSR